jgi:hypothetical protein
VADGSVRVVSWNVAFRVGDTARRQGEWIAALRPRPQLALLQEVKPSSIEAVSDTAGFD